MDIKDGDVLYVVGDAKSNNTNKLVAIGKNNGLDVLLKTKKYDADDDAKKDKKNRDPSRSFFLHIIIYDGFLKMIFAQEVQRVKNCGIILTQKPFI